jgi:ubiquinone/menaquinone biosynthesis C-methylase UbiE
VLSIVADAEQLPLRTGSVDVAFVHDGLHHLDDPQSGVTEMARVAGTALTISEPARAAVTALAIRLGIAAASEEAGNRVARLSTAEIRRNLQEAGFNIVTERRYALFYRHQPGSLMRLFSLPILFELSKLFWGSVSRIAGGFGNKLSVQARRA